ncbi:MAG: HAD family hydrolase [Micromonosporaceae bacterium]
MTGGYSAGRYQAVVFDCDGVLVDSERLSNVVFARVVTAEGLPTSFDDAVRRYLGRSTAECAAEIAAELGRPLRTDVIGEYERACAVALRAELVAVPGVVELLDALVAAGMPCCVASSGTPEEVDLRLKLTGLEGYFGEHIYSASMVPRGKPEPDLFLHAAGGLGVDPRRCLLIEDSPYGVRGGKAAGMTVVGLASLIAPDQLAAAGADLVVTDIGRARDLIGL